VRAPLLALAAGSAALLAACASATPPFRNGSPPRTEGVALSRRRPPNPLPRPNSTKSARPPPTLASLNQVRPGADRRAGNHPPDRQAGDPHAVGPTGSRGAALGSRTPDLRITRMSFRIPGRSTSTDSTTYRTESTPRSGRTRSVMPELMPATESRRSILGSWRATRSGLRSSPLLCEAETSGRAVVRLLDRAHRRGHLDHEMGADPGVAVRADPWRCASSCSGQSWPPGSSSCPMPVLMAGGRAVVRPAMRSRPPWWRPRASRGSGRCRTPRRAPSRPRSMRPCRARMRSTRPSLGCTRPCAPSGTCSPTALPGGRGTPTTASS
jgi:hypothetical protein